MNQEFNPVLGPEPESPRLANDGLTRVIFQVRFPEIISVQSSGFVAPFQEAVRATYPVLAREVAGLAPSPDGRTSYSVMWRMQDPQGVWRLTLASGFLSLETKSYPGRNETCARVRAVLDALAAAVRPTHMLRVGLRYVNHFTASDPSALPAVLRPGMIGPAAMAALASGRLGHATSEAAFVIEEGRLAARWGMLPPGATHDPACMPAVPVPSVFLDMDASAEWRVPAIFDAARAEELVRKFAGRCYTLFRWSASDGLIEAFGGKPSPLSVMPIQGQFSVH